ncbi:MAG: hypothetical protein J6K61_04865 [Clostridia bacterium]|nr:hypothetical protein [Clostridia bacterium]
MPISELTREQVLSLSKKMMHYFETAGCEGSEFKEGLPSFVRFAHREGLTVKGILALRERDEVFRDCYAECEEILKDRITDGALYKRLDSSFAKFLLAARYGYTDKEEGEEEGGFSLTVTVKEPNTCS